MVPKLGVAARMKWKATSKKKKVGNSVVREYEKLASTGRALPLDNDLTLFLLQWPQNAKKKRIHRLHSKNPGSMLLKKHSNGAKGRSETCSTHAFPDELVEEILSRLPVKCLARFSCVCKSWYHLIYSDQLTSLHINNYKTYHPLVDTSEYISGEFELSFLPASPLNYRAPQMVVKVVAPKSPNDRTPQLLVKVVPPLLGGSCNGILCLYKLYLGSIILWNPATKDFKSIPNSDIPRQDAFVTVKFGFDSNKNDYKILQMVSVGQREIIQYVRLYSLRKNSWRKIDTHEFTLNIAYWTNDLVCNLPSTNYRVICALTKPVISSRPTKLEILSFDLSTELFDIIEICPSLEAELSSGDRGKKFHTSIKLFHFKQSLAIGHNSFLNSQKQITNLWVSNESTRSWSKLFSVKVDIGFRLIGSWENRIIIQNDDTQTVGRFDPGKQKVTDYVHWTCGKATSTIYKESLVRVSEMNSNEDNETEEGIITCKQGVLVSDMNEDTEIKKGKKRTCKQGVLPTRTSSSWQFY